MAKQMTLKIEGSREIGCVLEGYVLEGALLSDGRLFVFGPGLTPDQVWASAEAETAQNNCERPGDPRWELTGEEIEVSPDQIKKAAVC